MAGAKQPVKAQKVPLTDEEIAQIRRAIREIGDLGKRLKASGLNQRAVIVLLQDSTGVPLMTIKRVLDGIDEIPADFLVSA